MIGTVLSWCLIGLLAGGIAKLIVPGKQGGGVIATIFLGILGALLGGFLGTALFGVGVSFTLPGMILAVLGSILLILIKESI